MRPPPRAHCLLGKLQQATAAAGGVVADGTGSALDIKTGPIMTTQMLSRFLEVATAQFRSARRTRAIHLALVLPGRRGRDRDRDRERQRETDRKREKEKERERERQRERERERQTERQRDRERERARARAQETETDSSVAVVTTGTLTVRDNEASACSVPHCLCRSSLSCKSLGVRGCPLPQFSYAILRNALLVPPFPLASGGSQCQQPLPFVQTKKPLCTA